MPIYHAEVIENKKKVDKWFTTREEAYTYLSRRAAVELLNKIPPKGLDISARAQILLDNLDALNAKLSSIDEDIQEYIKPK